MTQDGPDLAWADAHRLAYDAAEPLAPRRVRVESSVGTVLAQDLTALVPLPPFDTAAMDGYAVAGAPPWRFVGRLLAGHGEWPVPLTVGQALEIATGAVVPVGADAVLPYEQSRSDGGTVDALGVQETGRHIRRAGEECRAGDVLVPAGAVLTAAAVGLAAAVGHDWLSTYPRPRVGLLVSGDELLLSGLPGAGRVRDAVGPQLPALCRAAGGEPSPVRHVGDSAQALAGALAAPLAGESAQDVVVTTGASSVGPADHLQAVLGELGAEVLVAGVACRPGHPQLLARLPDGRWLVGLPGNPLAALVGVVTLLRPLLARLGGRPAPPLRPVVVRGELGPGRTSTRLVPARLDGADAVPLSYPGAAMLRGAALADGFVVVPAGGGPALFVDLPG